MKLTNAHRDSIASAATEFAFDPKQEALRAREHELATEAYDFLFPLSQRVAVNALPKFWFNRVAKLNFNVAGHKIMLSFAEAVRVPAVAKGGSGSPANGWSAVGAIPASNFADRIVKHVAARDQLTAERRAAQIDLRTMLSTITTDEQLREVWPEGEAFYSKFSVAPVSLPAVSMADINKRFGLPPDAADK